MPSRNKKLRKKKSLKKPSLVVLLCAALLTLGFKFFGTEQTEVIVEASVPPIDEPEEAELSFDAVSALSLDISRLEKESIQEKIEHEVLASEAESSEDFAAKSLELAARYFAQFNDGSEQIIRNTWSINRFVVNGNYVLSDREIVEWVADIEPDVGALLSGTIESRLKAHPWIESANITSRIYPFEIFIDVTEAKPWLVVELRNNESWLLSRSASILQNLATLDDPDLIVQVAELERLKLNMSGEEVSAANAKLLAAVKMVRLLELAGGAPFDIDHYEIENDNSLVLIPRAADIFPKVTAKPVNLVEAQLLNDRVRAVVSDAEKRKEYVASIDFRFRGQAVVKLRQ